MSLTTPNVLAIDTASPSPAVSVLTAEGAYDEALPAERQASERLLSAIETCLRAAGVALADCERIAVCSGPGSFTGVRVGLATAWGLSRATGRPLEPVSTLEVLAESVRGSEGAGSRVASAMDAGRGEVVWQPFDLSGTRARPLADAVRATPEAAAESAAASGMRIVCVPPSLFGVAFAPITPTEPLAHVLARTVARAPATLAAESGPLLSAFYSRPSAAQEKHGRP